MIYTITFIEVDDPVQAEASEKTVYDFVTSYLLSAGGISTGGLDRFRIAFNRYITHQFPDMIATDYLMVFHVKMSDEELSRRTSQISSWCVGWARYDKQTTTP